MGFGVGLGLEPGAGRGGAPMFSGFGLGLTTQSLALSFVSVTLPDEPPGRRSMLEPAGGASAGVPSTNAFVASPQPTASIGDRHPPAGQPAPRQSRRFRPCRWRPRSAHRSQPHWRSGHGGRDRAAWRVSQPARFGWRLFRPTRRRRPRIRSGRPGPSPAFVSSTYSSDADAPPVTTSAISRPLEGGQLTPGWTAGAIRGRGWRGGRHGQGCDRPEKNECGQRRAPGSNHRRPPGGDSRSGPQLYPLAVMSISSRTHLGLNTAGPVAVGGGRSGRLCVYDGERPVSGLPRRLVATLDFSPYQEAPWPAPRAPTAPKHVADTAPPRQRRRSTPRSTPLRPRPVARLPVDRRPPARPGRGSSVRSAAQSGRSTCARTSADLPRLATKTYRDLGAVAPDDRDLRAVRGLRGANRQPERPVGRIQPVHLPAAARGGLPGRDPDPAFELPGRRDHWHCSPGSCSRST